MNYSATSNVVTTIAAIVLTLAAAGCATVDPENDYDRAASLISEHTNTAPAFTPDLDEQVEARLSALLEGGLSLDESVQVALLNNRELQARFADIGIARADVVQSGLLSNPSLSLGFMLPQGGARSKMGLNAAQDFADLWKIPRRKKLAERQLEATLMSVVTIAVDLAAQTKMQYYRLVAVAQHTAIVEEAIAFAGDAADLTKLRFDAGEVTILDANLAQARQLDLRATLIGLRSSKAVLEASFTHLLGLPDANGLFPLLDGMPTALEPLGGEVDLIQWAAAHRVDVHQAVASMEAAGASLRREKQNLVPNVSLSLDVERSDARGPASPPFNPLGSVIAPGATAADLARDYVINRVEGKQGRDFDKSQQVDWLIGPGLQITMPLFDQNQAQIAKARYILWQEEKRLVDLFERIAEEVRTSTAVLRDARELSELFEKESLPLSEKTVGTAARLYAAGEDSFLAVLNAQDTHFAQRQANLEARTSHALALVELERTLGGRLPESDTAVNQATNDAS